jgi:hypothetical protein
LSKNAILGVLDEDASDTLVNVNLIDDERVEKNLKNLREAKFGGYNPYEEEIDPLTGDLAAKGKLLSNLYPPRACIILRGRTEFCSVVN